jgi:hypothetical protein
VQQYATYNLNLYITPYTFAQILQPKHIICVKDNLQMKKVPVYHQGDTEMILHMSSCPKATLQYELQSLAYAFLLLSPRPKCKVSSLFQEQ